MRKIIGVIEALLLCLIEGTETFIYLLEQIDKYILKIIPALTLLSVGSLIGAFIGVYMG